MINSPIFRRTLVVSVACVALITLFLVSGGPLLENSVSSATQPIGSGIVFTREVNQVSELWIADTNGQNERLLATRVTDFTISPGGAEIAYSVQPEDSPSKLEIINLATGKIRPLAGAEDESLYTPVWSPANGIITYERRTMSEAGTGAPKLWMTEPNGTKLGPVIKGGEVVAYGAKWSPDGLRMGFVDSLTNEIVIFNFTDVLRRVPVSGDFDWSPDGKRLVISALIEDKNGFGNRLIIYDLAAEQQIELTNPVEADDLNPNWSPDGKQVVFERRLRSLPRAEISVIDVDKAGDLNAVRSLASGGDVDNISPRWSPDGESLIWTRLEVGIPGAPASIWQINVKAGGEPTLLIGRGFQARWVK